MLKKTSKKKKIYNKKSYYHMYWIDLLFVNIGTELVVLSFESKTLEFGSTNQIKMEIEIEIWFFLCVGSWLKFLPHQIMYADVTHIDCSNMNQNASSMIYKKLEKILELVSKELNHFGVIADLFRQIGGHSTRFVLFCSFWRLFTKKW